MNASSPRDEARLRECLARVFSDGVLDASEREELRAIYARGTMMVPVVKRVFAEFVTATYAEVMADGVVTSHERAKLRAIVEGLKLPDACVPDEVKRVLAT